MGSRPKPPCLFCGARQSRPLPALGGHGAARGLGAVPAFCSVRCAARSALRDALRKAVDSAEPIMFDGKLMSASEARQWFEVRCGLSPIEMRCDHGNAIGTQCEACETERNRLARLGPNL